MYFRSFVKCHSDTGKDQEGPEQVDDPVERVEQDGPQRNHQAAHDQGAQDAPEKHPVLIGCWYTKEGEEQHKDEDVVNAEGLLDQIAREELQRRFRATEDVDPGVEDQRQCNPHGAPGQCLFDRTSMRFAMKHAQVKCEHRKNEDVKSYP